MDLTTLLHLITGVKWKSLLVIFLKCQIRMLRSKLEVRRTDPTLCSMEFVIFKKITEHSTGQDVLCIFGYHLHHGTSLYWQNKICTRKENRVEKKLRKKSDKSKRIFVVVVSKYLTILRAQQTGIGRYKESLSILWHRAARIQTVM